MSTTIKGLDGGSIGSDNSSPVDRIRASTPVNSGAAGTASTSSSSDTVNITDSAKTLASLSQAVSDSPDVDMNKVSAVQHALSSGTYTMSAEGIADRMLQLEQDLGSAQNR